MKLSLIRVTKKMKGQINSSLKGKRIETSIFKEKSKFLTRLFHFSIYLLISMFLLCTKVLYIRDVCECVRPSSEVLHSWFNPHLIRSIVKVGSTSRSWFRLYIESRVSRWIIEEINIRWYNRRLSRSRFSEFSKIVCPIFIFRERRWPLWYIQREFANKKRKKAREKEMRRRGMK